jgi:hypothetical protein
MELAQLSKARFFVAAAFVALLGVILFVRPAAAAPTITVYKTPT